MAESAPRCFLQHQAINSYNNLGFCAAGQKAVKSCREQYKELKVCFHRFFELKSKIVKEGPY